MKQSNFKFRKEALGERPATLLLKHCELVNVMSGRIEHDVDIAIAGHQIVGVGPGYEAETEIDVGRQFVYPGLVDAHIHFESSKLTIPNLARRLARYGTSTVITDPHEIANVSALDGIAYQLDTASDNGYLNVFFTAPSCVPALPDDTIETFGSHLGPSKVEILSYNPWFVALGEVMNVPGLINGDPKVMRKVKSFQERNLVIDGHAPMLSGKALNAYIYMGVETDHESTTPEEAQEKLDRGIFLLIREGSTEKNLDALLPVITPFNAHRIAFCSDDLDVTDIEERGHINHLVKRAVDFGIDPIMALQMATISPARAYGIGGIGAICPGYLADIVVSPDLKEFKPSMVLHHGKIVYSDGQILQNGRNTVRFLKLSMNAKLPSAEELKIPANAKQNALAISVVPGQITTNEFVFKPKIKQGCAVPDIKLDTAKIAVFERHHASGSFSCGFVHGFGIKRGAIASSVSHDSHNIVAVGMDDESIIRAAERVRDMGGGQVAFCDGEYVDLPLPIGGLMTGVSFDELVANEKELYAFVKDRLEIEVDRPFTLMSFLALPVIPNLRITDKGLIRIDPGEYPKKTDVIFDR